ncbi:MAG: endonuclease NucS domain-containing protein [Terracidiphilus sp.]
METKVNESAYGKVLGDLRAAIAKLKPGQEVHDIIARRDEVFAKYQPIFSTQHLESLSKEEFTSFLYFENNQHWSGLYRKGLHAVNDMSKLRKALEILLDESVPIQQRFPQAIGLVGGIGKATATGILTVAYPNVYGVWNNTSEAALRKVGLWPDFARGEGIGEKYAKINAILARIRTDLGIDFWTLDALWWALLSPQEAIVTVAGSSEPPMEGLPAPTQAGGGFALERQLQEFLLENWDRSPLASEWTIYSTDDDPEAGNEFPTDVGRVDILAAHKTQPRLLVIELKRNQSTDQTVGQVLRYMGWVAEHVGRETGKTVEGLIIARTVDQAASYALTLLPKVSMMTYEIEFRLKRWEGLRT